MSSRHAGRIAHSLEAAAEPPLVVDLDGTLSPTDLLMEALFRLLAVDPLGVLRLPQWLMGGKAAFKAILARKVALDLHTLPMNDVLVAFIRAERARGRRIYLATAADRLHAERLAEQLGLFDGVFASDGETNLGGAEKAQLLCREFGERGFDYVGDAEADLAVWAKARRAILVDASAGLRRRAHEVCPHVEDLAHPIPLRDKARAYLKAVRVHQWLKNFLVFVPLLADHALDGANLGRAAIAFLAFSLCAASVYLLNDLVDLPSDRVHPTKRHRPFAAGKLPLVHGMVLIPLLLLASLLVALILPLGFLAVLSCYYVITLLYSLVLKRQIIIDVVALAGLYTLRVIAGGEAVGIQVSEWLLAFSMFLFLCLALVKRYSELMERLRSHKAKPAGRGYVTDDTPMIGALAGASGFVSVLVLALYINSPDVHQLYRHPDLLWAIGVLMLYWICRVLLLAHRGQIHDDPVVFAMRDPHSLVTVVLIGVTVILGAMA